MFLSSDELRTLTGFSHRKRQAEWLRLNGWRHTMNARGDVIVDRRYYEKRMVGEEQTVVRVQPDFAALRG